MGGTGQLQPAQSEAQRCERRIPLRLDLLRQGVVLILRPAKPDLVDSQPVERLPRLDETGQVIPVLVRRNQEIDLASRERDNVLDHVGHFRHRIGRAEDDAAVDHHVERPLAAVGARQRNQEAIAQPLPVHADLCAVACGAPRACGRTAPRRRGPFCSLAGQRALLSVEVMHQGERLVAAPIV
jgi:hypothetical protein